MDHGSEMIPLVSTVGGEDLGKNARELNRTWHFKFGPDFQSIVYRTKMIESERTRMAFILYFVASVQSTRGNLVGRHRRSLDQM